MKIIVIQHLLRGSAAADLESLSEEVSTACALGAGVIVCPRVAAIQDGELIARPFLDRVGICDEGTTLLVPFAWPRDEGDELQMKWTPLGATALLSGDAALDADLLARLNASSPDALVLRPCAESPLQAEAFMEHAIALSASVAPVVIVAEPLGPLDEPAAFGGSAIAVEGELVAEAESTDESELLELNIDVPGVFNLPRERVPAISGILAQRWAHHHGTRAPIDYPADLS
jgi:hypothetical protein